MTPVGDIERVYTVCNVAVTTNTDNWLTMPYLAAEAASRIYVQVRFIMRRCASATFTDAASRHRCKVRIMTLHFKLQSRFIHIR